MQQHYNDIKTNVFNTLLDDIKDFRSKINKKRLTVKNAFKLGNLNSIYGLENINNNQKTIILKNK